MLNRTTAFKLRATSSEVAFFFTIVIVNVCKFDSRQSAPTDGRDVNCNIVAANKVALTSKQNSDASGFKYQWGRKDPYTFATSSEKRGSEYGEYGKYPVKIYTIDGVLIYQDDNGRSNTDKQPAGGVIQSWTLATSMMETIKNPIIFYWNNPYTVINQDGHTRVLWDYYWTSYSRGTDGDLSGNYSNRHNAYLDGYTTQLKKSIYDPCPYSFRIQSNGTFNYLSKFSTLQTNGYVFGIKWIIDNVTNWMTGMGRNNPAIYHVGSVGFYISATVSNQTSRYNLVYDNGSILPSRGNYNKSDGFSVRCIEVSPPQPTDEMLMVTL